MSDAKLHEILRLFISDVTSFLDELNNSRLSKQEIQKKSKLLERISSITDDLSQLATKKKVGEDNSSESPDTEVYEDLGNGVSINKITNNSSPDVSEKQSISSSRDYSDNASIRGYLIKGDGGKSKLGLMSKLKNKLAKKYCVVSNGMFYIYDNSSCKKISNEFSLSGGYEVRVSNEQQNKKEFQFELVCPGKKTYYFSTSSQNELKSWVSVLKSEASKGLGTKFSTLPVTSSTSQFYEFNDDENDNEEYEDAHYIANAVNSVNPDDDDDDDDDEEELYDDIAHPGTTKRISLEQMRPLSSSNIEEEDLYDDVAESSTKVVNENPPKVATPTTSVVPQTKQISTSLQTKTVPVVQQTKTVPVVQQTKTPTSIVTANKPVIVNTKDGLPYDKMFYGKWDCKAGATDELSFKHGDILTVVNQEFDNFGWWVAELKGTTGLVPRDFLTPAYEPITSR